MSEMIAPTLPVKADPLRRSLQLGPFRFDSEIEIAELEGVGGTAEIDVTIRVGGVPAELPHAARFGTMCLVAPSEYRLDIAGVGRFYVRDGREVRVEPAAGAPAADVSTYLLGSVFGALCHQNALLPLHASAVEGDRGVTAFLGDSGAGKSTLAACLERRGHRIVSDDICLLAPAKGAGGMRVIPVAGWVKLWRKSFAHLGKEPEETRRVYSADDKFRLYLEPPVTEVPALVNLVFLARSAGAAVEPRLEALGTTEAIALMFRLTYLGYMTELTGSHARVFRQCAQVLAGGKAYRLTVPWGFERMEEVLDLLERQVLLPRELPLVTEAR